MNAPRENPTAGKDRLCISTLAPFLAAHNVADGLLANPILSGKLPLTGPSCQVSLPDVCNLAACQFSKGALLSVMDSFGMCLGPMPVSTCYEFRLDPAPMVVASWLSVLCDHIGHVVSMGAQKEMGGVGASSVVTPMAYKHSYGDRTDVDFPGKAMRSYLPRPIVNDPITGRIQAPGPAPAWIGILSQWIACCWWLNGCISPEPVCERKHCDLPPGVIIP